MSSPFYLLPISLWKKLSEAGWEVCWAPELPETSVPGAFRGPPELVFRISLTEQVLKKAAFCASYPLYSYLDLPTSPVLPSFARPWGGIKAILPSRAHVSIRHQAARPPAGVSNQIQTLAGSHNIACELHAITKDLHFSRETPKPYFPCFATLP